MSICIGVCEPKIHYSKKKKPKKAKKKKNLPIGGIFYVHNLLYKNYWNYFTEYSEIELPREIYLASLQNLIIV